MAKLRMGTSCNTMNSLAGRFKGVLDFYFWKGIPCVWKWPYGAEVVNSLARQESYQAFSAIAAQKTRLPPDIVKSLIRMAEGSTWTWSDLFTSIAMNYYKFNHTIPPVPISTKITTGSGIRRFEACFDVPCNPFLGGFKISHPRHKTKTYRGRTEKCRVPNRRPTWGHVPMKLKYDSIEDFSDQRDGFARGVYDLAAGTPRCANHYADLLQQYGQAPATPAPFLVSRSWVNVFPIRPGWGGQVIGERIYQAYTPAWSPAFNPELYNGVQYKYSTSTHGGGLGGYHYCKVLGNNEMVPAVGNWSTTRTVAVKLRTGTRVVTSVFHPEYYVPKNHNICAQPTENKEIGSRLDLYDFKLTKGSKWCYYYDFPRSIPDGVYIEFQGIDGFFFPYVPWCPPSPTPYVNPVPPLDPEFDYGLDYDPGLEDPPENWWDSPYL